MCLGSVIGVFKPYESFMLLRAIIVKHKCFSKRFSKVIIYVMITIEHDILIELTSARPSGSFKMPLFRLGFQYHPRGPADLNA